MAGKRLEPSLTLLANGSLQSEKTAIETCGTGSRKSASHFHLALCRSNAKRQISAHNSGNAIPTAAADFGSKLRAVIPGNVFASRHQN
jgi:hypothetical protein